MSNFDDSIFKAFKLSTTSLIVFGVFVFGICSVNIFIASNICSNLQSEKKSEAMNGVGLLKVTSIFQLVMMVVFSFFFWNSQDKSKFALKICNICLCVVFTVMVGIVLNKLFKIKRDTINDSEMTGIFYLFVIISFVFGLSFVGNFAIIGFAHWFESTNQIIAQLNDIQQLTADTTNTAINTAFHNFYAQKPELLKFAAEGGEVLTATATDYIKKNYWDPTVEYVHPRNWPIVGGAVSRIWPSSKNMYNDQSS